MRWNRLSFRWMEECWRKKKNLISACFRSPDRRGTFRGHQSEWPRIFSCQNTAFTRLAPKSSQTSSPAAIFIGTIPAFVRISASGRSLRRTFGYFMNAENLLRDNEAHAGSKRLTNEKKSLFHGCERDFFEQMMDSSRISVQESARSSSTPERCTKINKRL